MTEIRSLEDTRLLAESNAIRAALRDHKGNVTHAAKALGVTYRTLRRRMLRNSIDRSDYLPAPAPIEGAEAP